MTFAGTELRELRSKVGERDHGDVFSRVYNVAPTDLDTIPARGEVIPFYEGVTSTSDGTPVKDNGTTTVTVDGSIFESYMVGWAMTFTATGNSYFVASYTSETILVVTGDASGEADGDTITMEESELLKPRATNVKYLQQKVGAFQQVQITFFQPVILAGGMSTDDFKEVRGSRTTDPGQFFNEAVILGVCSDDTNADVPTLGDKFPGDGAATLPRTCYSALSDPIAVPGLKFITARYRGSVGV